MCVCGWVGGGGGERGKGSGGLVPTYQSFCLLDSSSTTSNVASAIKEAAACLMHVAQAATGLGS